MPTKIPKELEKEICDLYVNGMSPTLISSKYNCSTTNIRNICERNNVLKLKSLSKKQLDNLIYCNENYFEVIDNSDKAWLLGFISGDASLCQRMLSIELSVRDVNVLEKIKGFLESNHEIRYRTRTHSVNGGISTNCSLTIYRRKICEDLIKLGITPNKSKELKLPPIKNELISHFMRGLVCSDGCFLINSKNTIQFVLASSVIDILEQFQNILINNLNFEKTNLLFSKGCFTLKYNGNFQVRKIFEYLYSDDMGNAYLDRKYNYCKQHFYNLDNNIKSRNENDPPLDRYSFTKDLRNLKILKSSERINKCRLWESLPENDIKGFKV